MIKKVEVTNNIGNKISIDLSNPYTTGFIIRSISGLGPPDVDVNITDIITRDGGLFNSARMNQRNIVFDIMFVRTLSGESIEAVRQKTYKYFPVKRQVSLLIETENRLVSISGYVESNEPDIFSSKESTKISIICPDPYFYDAKNGGDSVTTFYSVEPLFEFPFSNESFTERLLNMGEIDVATEGVVNYNGDSEVGMMIVIHALGLAENITIYNINTREQLAIDTDKIAEITGSGIVAGDDIFINTSKGEKSITLVRNGTSYNILNCLDKNVDWFTLVKGDNLFGFTADVGISNLQIQVINKTLYEGV